MWPGPGADVASPLAQLWQVPEQLWQVPRRCGQVPAQMWAVVPEIKARRLVLRREYAGVAESRERGLQKVVEMVDLCMPHATVQGAARHRAACNKANLVALELRTGRTCVREITHVPRTVNVLQLIGMRLPAEHHTVGRHSRS